jgi:hypothetical protein
MTAVRVCAILTIIALGFYYVLRYAATACGSHASCDVYIPFSLLLPLLVVVLALVTGVLAIAAVPRGATTWRWILGVCTLVSVGGPLVSLAIWRDNSDVFVAVATILVLVAPVCALTVSVMATTA